MEVMTPETRPEAIRAASVKASGRSDERRKISSFSSNRAISSCEGQAVPRIMTEAPSWLYSAVRSR